MQSIIFAVVSDLVVVFLVAHFYKLEHGLKHGFSMLKKLNPLAVFLKHTVQFIYLLITTCNITYQINER